LSLYSPSAEARGVKVNWAEKAIGVWKRAAISKTMLIVLKIIIGTISFWDTDLHG